MVIRRALRDPVAKRLMLGWILSYLVLFGAVVSLWFNADQDRQSLQQVVIDNQNRLREAEQTHMALCLLRGNLKDRVAQSEAFLEANPEGIPGIPVSLIEMGINRDKETLGSLNLLNCSNGE